MLGTVSGKTGICRFIKCVHSFHLMSNYNTEKLLLQSESIFYIDVRLFIAIDLWFIIILEVELWRNMQINIDS